MQADATERLPFDDGAFDLAYSSSVVEHVDQALRPAFAAEMRRIARGHYVQTPAYSFPIEPHALLPFRPLAAAHDPPPVLAPGRPGQLGGRGTCCAAAELAALFGEPVEAEHLGGLVKSWVALRAIDTSKG